MINELIFSCNKANYNVLCYDTLNILYMSEDFMNEQ